MTRLAIDLADLLYQRVKTGELNKAEEVLDVILPSGDEAAEVVHPGEEPFHFPATTITTELPSILSLASALPVRRDQFDVVLLRELFVERVRVVGLVADEPGGQFVEKASGKNFAQIRREEGCYQRR